MVMYLVGGIVIYKHIPSFIFCLSFYFQFSPTDPKKATEGRRYVTTTIPTPTPW